MRLTQDEINTFRRYPGSFNDMVQHIFDEGARAADKIDDPGLDGTDTAHPAWWRGFSESCRVFCEKATEILDGKDDGGETGGETVNSPWQDLRTRLLALVKQVKSVESNDRLLSDSSEPNTVVVCSSVNHKGVVKVLGTQSYDPGKIMKLVVDTREDLVRQGLIELGWTPPVAVVDDELEPDEELTPGGGGHAD